ncbi:hypothetical protein JBE04_18050 [Streptomyces sp. PRKS01-29]|nr:hypothetical protein [Streptomyces sabulosicollis]MBI0296315.1 hypothetical protein [Streptomyces sabulosicollis]
MTAEPAPIRRSDLPPTRPPEFELFTWFPLPDGGGDMVRGQRQRGVQVRRRINYGDWEPVRPDHWAAEPERQETSAGVPRNLRSRRGRPGGAVTTDLCSQIARAIHRYDYEHGLSGNDMPSEHHRGEAEAVLGAIQDRFVPPSPGSTEEQLPDDVLALIDPPPYLSTACEAAGLLEQAMAEHPERQAGLGEWARRMHQRCRQNNKFTGQLCSCRHHQR